MKLNEFVDDYCFERMAEAMGQQIRTIIATSEKGISVEQLSHRINKGCQSFALDDLFINMSLESYGDFEPKYVSYGNTQITNSIFTADVVFTCGYRKKMHN